MSIIDSHTHTVERLLPYMCKLNSIEIVAKMKCFIQQHNRSGDMSLTSLKELTKDAVQVVSASNWEGYSNQEVNKEKYYWNWNIIHSCRGSNRQHNKPGEWE